MTGHTYFQIVTSAVLDPVIDGQRDPDVGAGVADDILPVDQVAGDRERPVDGMEDEVVAAAAAEA